MSLLEPKSPRKRRSTATIICVLSCVGLLVSIGLCGTHMGEDVGRTSGFWVTVGVYLFFSSIGGLLLSFIVAAIQSQRRDD